MDCPPNPVDVICMCSSDGQIRPLRLRYANEQDQLYRVDIDEVVTVKPVSYVGCEGFIYLCRGICMGRRWMFSLKYSVRSHNWHFLGRLT